MTIAQALKDKNKKVANIQKLWGRIRSYNSIAEGSERPYDIEETYKAVRNEIDSLIDLKTRIHLASAPVRSEIFRLAELKSAVQQVKGIQTTRGQYRDRYSDSTVVQTAIFGVDWQDAEIEKIEAEIEKIQESLDRFNHSTNV